MSDLLNKASLVVIPSGYKEDTVYSVVPSDGSGDLSFTRASNGTRINSAGLVEVCPWNLLEQSEAFSNTSIWNVLNSATVSANTTTAPNGTTTADTLTFSANPSSNVYCLLTPTTGTFTFSVYAKTASGTKQFRLRADIPGGTASNDFTVNTEWQRFEFSVTGTPQTFYIINDSAGTAGSIYIWGAQLNIGSTAKPYFPTTDRLNVPRLTYQNGGGGCPSLLLEKQSTNFLKYSEDFTQSNWNLNYATVTSNDAISPDGTQNADLFKEDSTNNFHRLYDGGITVTAGAVYTSSVYAKNASGSRYLQVNFGGGYGENNAVFDLINGTVVSQSSATGTIESVGNGWYRCIVTATNGASNTNLNVIYYLMNGANTNYTGNGTSGVYLWGAQLEPSSYPTSYIPTTSASATRVADACYKDGLSVFGTNQGTFFVDAIGPKFQSAAQYLFDLSDNSAGNRFALYSVANNEFSLYTNTGNNFSANVFERNKIAVSWNGTTCKLYMNGTQMLNISCPTSNPTSINLNSRYNDVEFGDSQFNEVVCFSTALTNAELASLTTL
jgi:hypothetical protein